MKGFGRNIICPIGSSGDSRERPAFFGGPGWVLIRYGGFESRSPGERFGANWIFYNFVVRVHGHGAGRRYAVRADGDVSTSSEGHRPTLTFFETANEVSAYH